MTRKQFEKQALLQIVSNTPSTVISPNDRRFILRTLGNICDNTTVDNIRYVTLMVSMFLNAAHRQKDSK